MFVFLNKRPSPNMDLKTTNIMQVTFVKKHKVGNNQYRDRLKAKICDIFHSMFYCVQVLYTTNQKTSVFMGIFKNPLDTKRKSLKIY